MKEKKSQLWKPLLSLLHQSSISTLPLPPLFYAFVPSYLLAFPRRRWAFSNAFHNEKKKKNESKNLPLWSSNPISIKQSIFLSSFHFSILNSHFATYSFYIDHIIICMHMKGNNCQKQKIFFSIELIKYHRYICCVFYTFFIYPL